MSVGDIGINHGNARLQHVFDDGESLGRCGVEAERLESGDGNAVIIGDSAKDRSDVLQSEEGLITGVTAGFIGQRVGHGVRIRGADGIVKRAMDRGAFEVVGLVGLGRSARGFQGLRRAGAENLNYVKRRTLEDDVGR